MTDTTDNKNDDLTLENNSGEPHNNEESKGRRILLDSIYLLIWGIITLASSYNILLHDLDVGYILDCREDYNWLLMPFIIWLIAYYIDYIHSVLRKGKKHLKVSVVSVKRSTFAVTFFLFSLVVVLAQTTFLEGGGKCYEHNMYFSISCEARKIIRTVFLGFMFVSILLVKWSGLTSVYFRNEVQKK